MKQETKNNGVADVTVLTSEEGKDLYCNFLEKNTGKTIWLGYIYYDKDGKKLDTPHLLTPNDFTEVPEVTKEERKKLREDKRKKMTEQKIEE